MGLTVWWGKKDGHSFILKVHINRKVIKVLKVFSYLHLFRQDDEGSLVKKSRTDRRSFL